MCSRYGRFHLAEVCGVTSPADWPSLTQFNLEPVLNNISGAVDYIMNVVDARLVFNNGPEH